MSSALVTILLCTFNGCRYLVEQLESIERQSHRNWRLVISDDGSSDATLGIVREFAARAATRIEVRNGPRHGAAANFMSLVADGQLSGDYFAFCDQDDIWHPDKISRAVAHLENIPATTPAIYGARTRLIDAGGKVLGYSRLFRKPPSFRNALVQNILGGNTMLLNRAARSLIERSRFREPAFHDWWAYLLVSGAGGHVIYDPEPCLDYRQHGANVVSGMTTWGERARHSRWVYGGGFAAMTASNVAALRADAHLLTEANRRTLAVFEDIHAPKLAARLAALVTARPYRQHALSNLALAAAVVLRRV
jgi:glycosyltransferase involved in cell wall biosynthesis